MINNSAQIFQIKQFLIDFKEIITAKNFFMVPRDKNINGMISLNLNQTLAKNEILSLTYEDYHKGPEEDELNKGQVWIFCKNINSRQTYIKLKIDIKSGREIAKCLSFHPAEFTMKLPFGKGDK